VSQQKRYARGLLPQKELEAAIKGTELSAPAPFPVFEPISDQEVRDMLSDSDGEGRWEEPAIERREFPYELPLTEQVFEALVAIETAAELAGANAVLCVSCAWVQGCDWPEARRFYVRVSKMVGPLQIVERYALEGIEDWVQPSRDEAQNVVLLLT
jgi:hypothetical protein